MPVRMHEATHRKDTTSRNTTVNWKASTQGSDRGEHIGNGTRLCEKQNTSWANVANNPENLAWRGVIMQLGNWVMKTNGEGSILTHATIIYSEYSTYSHTVKNHRCSTHKKPRCWARTGKWRWLTALSTSAIIPYQPCSRWIGFGGNDIDRNDRED